MSTLKEKIKKTKKKVGIGLATTVAVTSGVSIPQDTIAQGFHLEPVQTSGSTRAPQQNQPQVRTMTPEQFQQARSQQQRNSPIGALWNSLPPHVQNEINTMGYQLSVEYSLKLNNALTPNSANKRFILYACAVTDIRQPGKIIYLPYYERDPRNSQRAMQPKILSAQAAVNQQTTESGVYRPEPNRFPTQQITVQGQNGSFSIDNKGSWNVRGRGGSINHNGRTGDTRTRVNLPRSNTR